MHFNMLPSPIPTTTKTTKTTIHRHVHKLKHTQQTTITNNKFIHLIKCIFKIYDIDSKRRLCHFYNNNPKMKSNLQYKLDRLHSFIWRKRNSLAQTGASTFMGATSAMFLFLRVHFKLKSCRKQIIFGALLQFALGQHQAIWCGYQYAECKWCFQTFKFEVFKAFNWPRWNAYRITNLNLYWRRRSRNRSIYTDDMCAKKKILPKDEDDFATKANNFPGKSIENQW